MHCSFCSGFAVQPASECCMTMMMMFATSAPGICGLWKHPCADSNPPQGCARIQNLLICNSLTSLFLYMIYTSCCLCNVSMIRYDMMMLRTVNKNRSRVSCAHNTSRASIGIITHDLEISVNGHSRSLETGAIRKLGCSFLFEIYSNYGRICSRL